MTDNIYAIRRRSDLEGLKKWAATLDYEACSYDQPRPGFRRIFLNQWGLPIAEVLCVMPSLFDDALHIVRLAMRVSA
jgi:hypothetical protein